MTTIMDMATESKWDEKFREFHEKNPHVYEELVKMARRARDKGFTKLGIDFLVTILVWEKKVDTTDREYRINRNFTSRYSRLIMKENPDLAGMFRTRPLRS